MTREEEIQRESDSRWLYDSANNQRFVEACHWADQHPKKGLWDAEKVIKWILKNADKYIWYDENENTSGITYNFIKALKKAMEE